MKPKISSANLPPRLRIELWISLYLLADKLQFSTDYIYALLAFAALYVFTVLYELSIRKYCDIFDVLDILLSRTKDKEP